MGFGQNTVVRLHVLALHFNFWSKVKFQDFGSKQAQKGRFRPLIAYSMSSYQFEELKG